MSFSLYFTRKVEANKPGYLALVALVFVSCYCEERYSLLIVPNGSDVFVCRYFLSFGMFLPIGGSHLYISAGRN